MTLAIRILIGLVAGFLLGLALAGSSSPAAAATIGFLTPVGTIFVDLIRMTVVPLVVSLLISSIGSMTDDRKDEGPIARLQYAPYRTRAPHPCTATRLPPTDSRHRRSRKTVVFERASHDARSSVICGHGSRPEPRHCEPARHPTEHLQEMGDDVRRR
jgi:hypothetical protein